MSQTQGYLLSQFLLVYRLGHIHVVERVDAVFADRHPNACHLFGRFERIGVSGTLSRCQVLEHRLHIALHVRYLAKLTVQYLQALTGLRVVRQILGHVRIDVDIRYRKQAYDSKQQCRIE